MRQSDRGAAVGTWLVVAALIGMLLQVGICLRENLLDEAYFARNFIATEADRLAAATTVQDGQVVSVGAALAHYGNPQSRAYGFRIVDARGAVLAQSNAAMIETVSPLSGRPGASPDVWQQKIGAGWFEIAGGVRRRIGGQDVWIEVATLGDPEYRRLRALAAELLLDVWIPLSPTVTIMMLVGVLVLPRLRRQPKRLETAACGGEIPDWPARAMQHLRMALAPFGRSDRRAQGRIQSVFDAHVRRVVRVAHELKSQLTIVLLELNKISGDTARRIENDIGEISGTVNSLISTMATAGAGESTASGRIDIVELAGAAVNIMLPLARSRLCLLSVWSDRAQSFEGDRLAVFESVLAILENAIRHGPEGNFAEVHCGPGATITIHDGGPAPNETHQDYLRRMGLLEKLPPADGFGFDVIRRAVDSHNGTIEIGRSPFGGTRICLKFRPFDAKASSAASSGAGVLKGL